MLSARNRDVIQPGPVSSLVFSKLQPYVLIDGSNLFNFAANFNIGFLQLVKAFYMDMNNHKFLLYHNTVQFVPPKLPAMYLESWIRYQDDGNTGADHVWFRPSAHKIQAPSFLKMDMFARAMMWKLSGAKTKTSDLTNLVNRRIELNL